MGRPGGRDGLGAGGARERGERRAGRRRGRGAGWGGAGRRGRNAGRRRGRGAWLGRHPGGPHHRRRAERRRLGLALAGRLPPTYAFPRRPSGRLALARSRSSSGRGRGAGPAARRVCGSSARSPTAPGSSASAIAVCATSSTIRAARKSRCQPAMRSRSSTTASTRGSSSSGRPQPALVGQPPRRQQRDAAGPARPARPARLVRGAQPPVERPPPRPRGPQGQPLRHRGGADGADRRRPQGDGTQHDERQPAPAGDRDRRAHGRRGAAPAEARALLDGLPKGEPHKLRRPAGPPSSWPELVPALRKERAKAA